MVKRLAYLDAVKAFGVFLIIMGHNEIPWNFYNWIYSFHVPLFFIISGFFVNTSKPILSSINKDFHHLILPTIYTTFFCVILLSFIFVKSGCYQGPPSYIRWIICSFIGIEGQLPIGMWFLWALAWGKSLLRIELHFIPQRIAFVTSVILFLIVIQFSGFYKSLYNPFCFLQGVSSMVFMQIGQGLKRYRFFENVAIWKIICSAAILCLTNNYPVESYRLCYPLSLLNILTGSLASISLCVLFFILYKVMLKISIIYPIFNFLSNIGQHTLFLLCVHSVIHTLQIQRHFSGVNFGILEVVILGLISMLCIKKDYVKKTIKSFVRCIIS